VLFGAAVDDDAVVVNGGTPIAAHLEAVLFVSAAVDDDVAVTKGGRDVAAHIDPAVRDCGAGCGGGRRRRSRRGACGAGGV